MYIGPVGEIRQVLFILRKVVWDIQEGLIRYRSAVPYNP